MTKAALRLISPLLFILLACSPDRSPDASDGGAAAAARPLEVILEITGTDPDGSPNFGFAFDAAYLPDGSVAIADQAASTVRFFSPDGELLRSAGQAGSGPGEFGDLGWIELCGGSILVQDYSTVKEVTTEGVFVREGAGHPAWVEVACNDEGMFAGIDSPRTFAPMSERGERIDAPVWVAEEPMAARVEFGPMPFGENRPLGKRTRIAIDSSFIYLGVPDSAAIDVLDHTGSKVRTLQLREPLRPASIEHYEAIIEEMVMRGTDAAMAEEFSRQIRAIPMPETLPPYSGLFVERDGIVWAVLSAQGDPTTRLRAVSIEGDILADVTIPADLKVFDVGPDFVIGRVDDPVSGEQRVVVYRKNAL